MTFDSLEQLAHRCGERAWRVARALCGNSADAEDAVQEAFVVAARKRHAIPKDDPWPWFAQVVAFEVRNLRRKRAAAKAREAAMLLPTDMPEHDSSAQEMGRAALAALAELPEDEREALTLTHVSGLGVRDAALAAGISKSALDRRVQSGLQRMRARLRCAEGALLGCLPLISIESPPKGYAVCTERWLTRAKALSLAAPPAILGGSNMLKVFTAVGAIVTALVLLGVWHPWQRTPTPLPVNSLVAEERAPEPGKQSSSAPVAGNSSAESSPTMVDSKDDPKAAAKDELAPPHDRASGTFAIRGSCREYEPNAEGKWLISDRPLAGVTIWVLPLGADADDPWEDDYAWQVAGAESVKTFSTMTAADGTWVIEDIPWLVASSDSGPGKPVVAVHVVATHPRCWGWDKSLNHPSEGGNFWAARRGNLEKLPAPWNIERAHWSSVRIRVSGSADKPEFSYVNPWDADGMSVPSDGDSVDLAPSSCVEKGVIRMALAPSASISGIVTDEAGRPVSGANVGVEDPRDVNLRESLDRVDEITADGGQVEGHYLAQCKTDRAGHYRLQGVHPAGKTMVTVELEKARVREFLRPRGKETLLNMKLGAPAKMRVRFMPRPDRTNFKGLYLWLANDATFGGGGLEAQRIPENRVIEFEGLEVGRVYQLRLLDFEDWLQAKSEDPDGADETSLRNNPDVVSGATTVRTAFFELWRSGQEIEISEPYQRDLDVRLPSELLIKTTGDMCLIVAPADIIERASHLSGVLEAFVELQSEQSDDNLWKINADGHTFKMKYSAHCIPSRRLRIVAYPAAVKPLLFKFRHWGDNSQRYANHPLDEIQAALERTYLSEPFDLVDGSIPEIPLASTSLWEQVKPVLVAGTCKGARENDRLWLCRASLGSGRQADSWIHCKIGAEGAFAVGGYLFPGEYRWRCASWDDVSHYKTTSTVTLKASDTKLELKVAGNSK